MRKAILVFRSPVGREVLSFVNVKVVLAEGEELSHDDIERAQKEVNSRPGKIGFIIHNVIGPLPAW